VQTVLAFLGLDKSVFHALVTAEDVVKGKPSPEPYLLAAVEIGRPPPECVVVEDSPSGIASARRAGMRCVAIASTHDKVSLGDADVVLDSVGTLDDDEMVRALLETSVDTER
jgi:sugar-phosphatase